MKEPKSFYEEKYPYQNVKSMVCTNIPLQDIYILMKNYAKYYHKESLKFMSSNGNTA